MITIHEKNSTAFNTLGLGALLPSLCTVTEELNGLYELELQHPYDKWGKWEKIEKERIIYAPTPSGKQPFRIYYVNPTLEGIKVNARHIFYDLLDNLCLSVNATGTPQAILNAVVGAFAYTVPFIFSTAMTGTGTVNLTKANPVTALLDSSDDGSSFIKAFGGEILRDGFSVTMATSIGQDRGVAIRYGKNLVGLEISEDISDVATRIYAYGKDGVAMSGLYLDSPYIDSYANPKIYVYEDNDLTAAQLPDAVQGLFDGGADLPKVNIKADFQILSKTEEYKEYAILEEVYLGDLVTVTNSKMNFSKKAKVISYEWDCLLERYNQVELGDFVADLTSSVTSGEKSLATATYASVEVQQLRALIESIDVKTASRLTRLWVPPDTAIGTTPVFIAFSDIATGNDYFSIAEPRTAVTCLKTGKVVLERRSNVSNTFNVNAFLTANIYKNGVLVDGMASRYNTRTNYYTYFELDVVAGDELSIAFNFATGQGTAQYLNSRTILSYI